MLQLLASMRFVSVVAAPTFDFRERWCKARHVVFSYAPKLPRRPTVVHHSSPCSSLCCAGVGKAFMLPMLAPTAVSRWTVL